MTDAEALLWKLVRNRRIANAKFRRQHPVGRYILDFYCDERKLTIELDGGQHGEAAAYDERRDAWLSSQGIQVLRFWNNQVLTETEAVMEVVYQALTVAVPATSLTPAPLPPAGEGCPSPSNGTLYAPLSRGRERGGGEGARPEKERNSLKAPPQENNKCNG